jgi:hypothetical protein
MPKSKGGTKSELFAGIERAWDELQAFLARLTEDQLQAVRDPAGWTVKDHLTHLSAWEDSIAALFRGETRHRGLGVPQELYAAGAFDAINAAIHEQRKDYPVAQVLAQARTSHQTLMDLVRPLSDDDLDQPVRSYFRGAPPGDGRRVIELIRDNTEDHFSEHLGWMRQLVSDGATRTPGASRREAD